MIRRRALRLACAVAGLLVLTAPAAWARPAGTAPVKALGSTMGLYVGAGAAFLALALLFLTLAWRPQGRALKLVRRSLRLSTRSAGQAPADARSSSALARRAVDLVEQLPKPKGLEEKLQAEIDRSGWPLRASEFLALQAGGLIVGFLAGFGLFHHWLFGLLVGIAGAFIPRVALDLKVKRRSAAFIAQLPDTLQLLSASLRAGYGLLQAMDTVTKEAQAPTSEEFARVLAEARLGMALENALEGMAARVGGDDVRWVVLAINIHRQVGGNLAEVLETVANTIREREQLRRQVKTLSAEGRLSAVILAIIPFLMVAYMLGVNPSYIGTLFSVWVGKVMVAGAVVAMAIGIAWMRKMIRIEV